MRTTPSHQKSRDISLDRRTLLGKYAQSYTPTSCLFELTYCCNLPCIHCYLTRDKKKELTKEEIFPILEQLKSAGCLYLTFTGGEILTRKDFFIIAEYSRKLNFAIRLFTNATLIDEDAAKKIKALQPMKVEVSMYGFRDTHESITGSSGSFDRTVSGIRRLLQCDVRVAVKSMVLKQNVDEFWSFKKYIIHKLKGVEWRGIGGGLNLCFTDDGDRGPLAYQVDDDQLRAYLQEERKNVIPRLRNAVSTDTVKKNYRLCGAGIYTCNITPYGAVNPCVQIRTHGSDLRKQSFAEIWQEDPTLKRLRALRVADRQECMGCDAINYCTFCPGIALPENGSYIARYSQACRVARIRKEVYG